MSNTSLCRCRPPVAVTGRHPVVACASDTLRAAMRKKTVARQLVQVRAVNILNILLEIWFYYILRDGYMAEGKDRT